MLTKSFSILCGFTSLIAANSLYDVQSPIKVPNDCPSGVHIIATRATTEAPGYGEMHKIVDILLNALPGSDAWPNSYPAAGQYDEYEYAWSVSVGIANLTAEIVRFTEQCPHNGIVLLGYSQGGQVTGDVLCGRKAIKVFSDLQSIDDKYKAQIKAIIQLGDPSNPLDLPWHAGSSTGHGTYPREALENCSALGHRWQSYCDDNDPVCTGGHDFNVHLQYVDKHLNEIVNFILKLVLGTEETEAGAKAHEL